MNCETHQHPGVSPTELARRWFLKDCAVGLGGIALAQWHSGNVHGQPVVSHNALAPKQPHFVPKAKRVIFLFMAGAPSQLETFDYKPELARLDATLPPPSLLEGYRAAFINPNSKLLGPKFQFAQHGSSGAWVSELLPHTAKIVDRLTIVKSMVTDAFNHAPAQILMNTGTQQFGRPSLGAWTLYGLGSETSDLPAFVVFSSGKKGPSGGNSNWGSGFLPTLYAGVPFRGAGDPVLYLSNPPGVDRDLQRSAMDTIRSMNQERLGILGDPEIASRINAYEMAFRMQASAPELMDLASESQETLDLYGAEPGKPSFANNCLYARRLVERGVRFVQLYHEAWDQHGNLTKDIAANCKNTDQACAALVTDLARRGLLDDTLVIWGGEFGRTPMVQGGNDGRDHHPNAFTMWFAGGGMKPGLVYGESDALGFNAIQNRVHVHDLNATILHLLGLDHLKLTFRFQGRDYRLTDVHGNVIQDLIA
jgi:hypothetical protein